MVNLYIEATKSTPEIDLNCVNCSFSIKGESYPENAFKFFEQIFSWMDVYFENTEKETIINFEIVYMNTSSTKCIMDIMFKLEQVANRGKSISVNWYYTKKNRSIFECGEEFKEDLEGVLKFNLCEKYNME